MKSEPDQRRYPLWNTVALLVLLIAFGFLAYQLRTALYPILFGALIAIAVFPWIRSMDHNNSGRLLVTVLFFLFGLLLMALILGFLAAQISSLFGELFTTGPNGEKIGLANKAAAQLQTWFGEMNERFHLGEKGRAWAEDFPAKLEQSWESLSSTAGNAFLLAVGIAGSILSLLSLLFLTPLFAFLFVLQYEKIRAACVRLAKPENRERTKKLVTGIESALGGFLRGRVLTGGIRAVGQTALLLAIGAPYAVLSGLLFWLLCFVPILGPVIAFLPTLLLLAVAGSWTTFFLALGILVVGEVIESYVLIPKLVGQSLGLSTLELLAAILIGGAALGFLGLLFAVPAASIGKLLINDWMERREKSSA